MEYIYSDELKHHGVLGQKWGIRRYQNEDGTLTAKGKARQRKDVASDKRAMIVKGQELYRISSKKDSDASSDKLYVSATSDSGSFYTTQIGRSNIFKSGEAFKHIYETTKDLKIPDKKTMEKVELSLMKNTKAREEVVNSLMSKGYTREQAMEKTEPYSKARAAKNAAGVMLAMSGLYGAMGSIGFTGGPGVGAITTTASAAGGMLLSLPIAIQSAKEVKISALNTIRTSYGDKNNVVTNEVLKTKLSNIGYNAMKDYNDRRAFGEKGKQAIIVFDSDKNVKLKSSSKIDENEYAKDYASTYLRDHPKTKITYDSLIEDGKKQFKTTYESGLLDRANKLEREQTIAKQKELEEKKKT